MTGEEFARMNAGFDRHTVAHGNPVSADERYGFVAEDAGRFVGCSSGLAEQARRPYGRWFYLTDLYVEDGPQVRGIGTRLLDALEARVAGPGVGMIWTWTAGYEGAGFYEARGYARLCELEGYYASGHARVALCKAVASGGVGDERDAAWTTSSD